MAAKKSAIEAGYSKKNADPSGYQARKTIKGRAADLMARTVCIA
jgi:phage terminase small subunit